MTLPQWSTRERRKHLVKLFDRCGGYCVFGDKGCQISEHHYEMFIEGIIDSWKAEDRERRAYEWKLGQQQIIDGTYGRYGTTFDSVARDVFVNSRPEYYLVALGVNPFTYKPVALAISAANWATQTSPVSGGASERSANQPNAQLMNDMDRQLKDIGALLPGFGGMYLDPVVVTNPDIDPVLLGPIEQTLNVYVTDPQKVNKALVPLKFYVKNVSDRTLEIWGGAPLTTSQWSPRRAL